MSSTIKPEAAYWSYDQDTGLATELIFKNDGSVEKNVEERKPTNLTLIITKENGETEELSFGAIVSTGYGILSVNKDTGEIRTQKGTSYKIK